MRRSDSVCFVLTQPTHYGFYQGMVNEVAPVVDSVVIVASAQVTSLLALSKFANVTVQPLEGNYWVRTVALFSALKGAGLLICDEPYIKAEFLPILMTAAISQIQLWVIVHNANTWFYPASSPVRGFKILAYYRKRVRQRANGFIVVSSSIKRYLETSGLCSEPVYWFPFGKPVPVEDTRKERQQFDAGLTIAIPGVVDTRKKDYKMVIDAFKVLWERGLKIELLLLGRVDPNSAEISGFINTSLSDGEPKCKRWTSFIPPHEFEAELKRTDILLSNVRTFLRKNDGTLEIFGVTKETGVTSVTEQYGIPGLVPSDYSPPAHLLGCQVHYRNSEHLISMLERLMTSPDWLSQLQEQARRQLSEVQLARSEWQRQVLSVLTSHNRPR